MTYEEAIKQLAIALCRAEGEDPYHCLHATASFNTSTGDASSKCDRYLWEDYRPQARAAYDLGARPKREFPQEGDRFWHLSDDGEPIDRIWRSASDYAKPLLRQGNVFPSKEAAAREARRREVRAQIAAIDARCDPGTPYTFAKTRGDWQTWEIRLIDTHIAGRIEVNSIEAAERVLAKIPAEDLDLLTMEAEFVPPKEG